MITPIYSYSLLKYRHSQILGELLNVGLLVFFHQNQSLHFIYPDKLIRLKFAYPNVQDKTIKSYFKSFELRLDELNKNPEIFAKHNLQDSLSKFIEEELLPSDSSALQFSETKKGIVFNPDNNVVLNQLYNLYFSVFEHDSNTIKKNDESELLTQYKTFIKEFEKDIFQPNQQKIQLNYILKQSENKEYKFEAAWKNHQTLNLVKPISFDLTRKDSIQNKSFRYFGLFTTLEEKANSENLKFDILLARPKKKELFKYYDDALTLLSKPSGVTLIEEEEIKTYSEKTIQTLQLFDIF